MLYRLLLLLFFILPIMERVTLLMRQVQCIEWHRRALSLSFGARFLRLVIFFVLLFRLVFKSDIECRNLLNSWDLAAFVAFLERPDIDVVSTKNWKALLLLIKCWSQELGLLVIDDDRQEVVSGDWGSFDKLRSWSIINLILHLL